MPNPCHHQDYAANHFAETTNDFIETANDVAKTGNVFRETANDFVETPNDFTETVSGFAETPNDLTGLSQPPLPPTWPPCIHHLPRMCLMRRSWGSLRTRPRNLRRRSCTARRLLVHRFRAICWTYPRNPSALRKQQDVLRV